MLLFVWFGFHNHVMLTCLPVMQRLQKPLAATRTGKVYSSHVAFKLLLNFHFSNWWVWPSLKVSATLNWEQERDKWIITILKTREIPCSFLPLWTHLSLFSASTTARLPTVVCYCCWISAHRWWLWKLNVLALYLCSPLFLRDVAFCLGLNHLKPQRS